MDKLIHFIDNLTAWINGIPPHSWYVLGTVIAAIFATIGITEWTKRHHFKVKSQELASHFIALNLVVWSTVMTAASFILTNGSAWGTFLPFINEHMAQILAGATTVYTFSKATYNWFKAHKGITNVNTPDLATSAATEASPTISGLSSSLGTQAAGIDVVAVAPPENLFQ
jgi:hypothetical protein